MRRRSYLWRTCRIILRAYLFLLPLIPLSAFGQASSGMSVTFSGGILYQGRRAGLTSSIFLQDESSLHSLQISFTYLPPQQNPSSLSYALKLELYPFRTPYLYGSFSILERVHQYDSYGNKESFQSFSASIGSRCPIQGWLLFDLAIRYVEDCLQAASSWLEQPCRERSLQLAACVTICFPHRV